MTPRIPLLLLALATPAAADAWKAAFKPLRLPKPAQMEKSVRPLLPAGIVIEAKPFDTLVRRLLEPHAARLAERVRLMRAEPSGKRIAAAFKVMARENAGLSKRVAAIEQAYAAVYNRGFLESSEGARRARKLAAVLVPLYRTIMFGNAAAARAASTAMASMKQGAGLAWLLGPALAAPEPALRASAARALGRVHGDAAQAALRRAAAKDAHPAVRTRALSALLSWKIAAIKDAVLGALSDPAWEVRALAVAICARAKLVEAGGALIDALAKERGRLRTDVDDALFALLGVRMYGDVALWRSWWAANRDGVARKAEGLAEEYQKILGPVEEWDDAEDAGAQEDKKKPKGATSAFYGITTKSKRIVFVIDISRSMQDPAGATPAARTGSNPYTSPKGNSKLDIARWQLHRAVHDLPKDAVFNIVVYSESYKLWETKVAAAKAGNKKKAHRFIDGLNGNGVTNIADSLDTSFALAGALPMLVADKRKELWADTIFLLSDGNPNRGRLSDLQALLDDLTARNRLARLVIHTIGIGEAEGSSFLKALAKRNGGQYVGFR